MKKSTMERTLWVAVPAIMLGVSSCSTSGSSDLEETPVAAPVAAAATGGAAPSAEATSALLMEEGVPGGIIIDTLTLDAQVVAIDHVARTVSLLMPGGETVSTTVGPEAINFNLVQKGDRVKALVAEELAIYLGDENSAADDGAGAMAVLAGKGEQPGGVVAGTVRATATVTAINLDAHAATLKFDDGTTKTVNVRPDVDLTKQKVGAKVVFEITKMVALSVEKK